MNHPYALLQNILTFMWCIWKSRNDFLFQRKKGEPYQIFINTQALINNLELHKPTSQNVQENSHLQLQVNELQLQVNEPTLSATRQGQDQQQGVTISPDNLVEGTLIFANAAWKCRKIPGMEGREATGIGVHIRDNSDGRRWHIKIQAAAPHEQSVFQAEAKALLLAAKLAQSLHFQVPKIFTDNQVLAKVAAGRRLDHPLVQWNARAILAEFYQATSGSLPQVFHISRKFNQIAHSCAAQVLRQSLNQPIFRCSNSAHSTDGCPVISTLQNVQFQDIVILAAWCS